MDIKELIENKMDDMRISRAEVCRRLKIAPQGWAKKLTDPKWSTIEDVCEPYLMQIGFLSRTPRGRCATRRAYEHLGIPFHGSYGTQMTFDTMASAPEDGE
jgi:hypothetical protein